MNVNFVSEFNMLFRFAKNNGLSVRERMLWVALFYIANDRATYNETTQTYDWPDGYFPVANSELNLYSCLDKRGIEAARNLLKQRGLIDFIPGMRNKRNPEYRINYLSVDIGYKNVPNDVPSDEPRKRPGMTPESVQIAPNSAPREAPYSKYNRNQDTGEEQGGWFKKKYGIDDNYLTSGKARGKVAQLVADEILARKAFSHAVPYLHDAVCHGLGDGWTPEDIIDLAESTGDWGAFAAAMMAETRDPERDA